MPGLLTGQNRAGKWFSTLLRNSKQAQMSWAPNPQRSSVSCCTYFLEYVFQYLPPENHEAGWLTVHSHEWDKDCLRELSFRKGNQAGAQIYAGSRRLMPQERRLMPQERQKGLRKMEWERDFIPLGKTWWRSQPVLGTLSLQSVCKQFKCKDSQEVGTWAKNQEEEGVSGK